MRRMEETARVEVWNEIEDAWVPCHVEQLDPGDVFRLHFVVAGERVQHHDAGGQDRWRCTQVPWIDCESLMDEVANAGVIAAERARGNVIEEVA